MGQATTAAVVGNLEALNTASRTRCTNRQGEKGKRNRARPSSGGSPPRSLHPVSPPEALRLRALETGRTVRRDGHPVRGGMDRRDVRAYALVVQHIPMGFPGRTGDRRGDLTGSEPSRTHPILRLPVTQGGLAPRRFATGRQAACVRRRACFLTRRSTGRSRARTLEWSSNRFSNQNLSPSLSIVHTGMHADFSGAGVQPGSNGSTWANGDHRARELE
jgi:hypothetical protein